ncbi:uncharacterized protein LOC135348214 [Halichondria panicea]|uniref:uncharacterized protein LOC135348214 n=1 Tax=Halichondria panicea TaxID=6063 RepID=UPI00312BB2EB
MGTDETSKLVINGNNNQDSSLRERVSKYLLPVMVAVIALVVTALTATIATSNTMATYNRCYQNLANCTANGFTCTTASFPYNISGYYTTDIRCEYEADNSIHSYIHAYATLQRSGNIGDMNVTCWCQANLNLQAVSKDNKTLITNDKCWIVVTRCPE